MTENRESFWKRNLDKIGIGGSLFAALCCLGFPALLSIVSAIGLGFLINDVVLLPLLIFFLVVTVAGLALGMRHHGSPWALILGLVSAIATFLFIFVAFNKVLAGAGIAGLIIASIVNVWLRMRKAEKV